VAANESNKLCMTRVPTALAWGGVAGYHHWHEYRNTSARNDNNCFDTTGEVGIVTSKKRYSG